MLPFGAWHPDAAGINSPAVLVAKNVTPAVTEGGNGVMPAFAPSRAPVAVSDALPEGLRDDSGELLLDDLGVEITTPGLGVDSVCYGIFAVVENGGIVVRVAGTASDLFHLIGSEWIEVSRASGGAYATAFRERWRFAGWNPFIIATNYTDDVQKYDTSAPSPTFTALGGSPPKARFVGVVRDQVVLAGLDGHENRLAFSGFNDSESWPMDGTNGSDFQDFPDGGPLTGFVGGPVGHVFQPQKVTRMTQVTDATILFQFDEVQGGKGCVASNSIVKVGDLIYYFSADGFQVLSITTGQVQPIGENKWRRWFLGDYRAGTEPWILGAIDPLNPVIRWAYVSGSSPGNTPTRVIVYNWKIDEATFEEYATGIEAMTNWLSGSVTLDDLGPYGTLDTLPFSLDSPFWKGGVPLLSMIDGNHKLNYLEGAPLAAEVITADGMGQGRSFIRGTRPLIDTTQITGAIAMRERDGDAIGGEVNFPVQEVMEDTGVISAHTSGNIARAKYQIPAGADWLLFKGIDTSLGRAGRR